MSIFQIVLTSSVISGVLSAIISYYFNLKIKRLDFKNEYYKSIIQKRMDAYQFVENQVSVLKGIVFGDDKQAYHMILCYGEDKFLEFQQNILIAISKGLWIDDDTMNTLEEINGLFFNINKKIHNKNQDEIETIGKEYYKKISDLRFKLENNLKGGLIDLHNVEKIFKKKEKNNQILIYGE